MTKRMEFPQEVWTHVLSFALHICPECGGECALEMPCWMDDLSQYMNGHPPERQFRELWYRTKYAQLRNDEEVLSVCDQEWLKLSAYERFHEWIESGVDLSHFRIIL